MTREPNSKHASPTELSHFSSVSRTLLLTRSLSGDFIFASWRLVGLGYNRLVLDSFRYSISRRKQVHPFVELLASVLLLEPPPLSRGSCQLDIVLIRFGWLVLLRQGGGI